MSNRELIEKLRRNPRGVMFELEHECADALEKAEAELAAIKAAQPSAISDERIREIGKDAFGIDLTFDGNLLRFARAIIAAAQEGK